MLPIAKRIHSWILGLTFIAEFVVAGAGGLMFLAAFIGVTGWVAVILANRWKKTLKAPRIVEVTAWVVAPFGALAAIGLLYWAAFGNMELRASLPIYVLAMSLEFVSLLAGISFDPFPDDVAGDPATVSEAGP